jgi:DNA-binding transcriptional LysR family regulator
MDRFEAMRVFVAVAEQQSFAAAGRRLGLSAPAVTRAVAALESRLSASLLRRTTRSVQVTDAGARFLADAKRLLHELEGAEQNARGAHAAPTGQLTVTAPLMFGRIHVAPIVLEMLAKYPEVRVRTLFADQVVDLMDEGVDVAVRIGALASSSLRAIRVGSVRRVVCASPRYLEQHGTPSAPADLASHALLGFVGISEHRLWTFRVNGKLEALEVQPRLTVNTADVAIAAAIQDRGLTRVLSYQVEAELRAGSLKRVLASYEPQPVPIHVLHASGKRVPARVRAFVDLAVTHFKALGLR